MGPIWQGIILIQVYFSYNVIVEGSFIVTLYLHFNLIMKSRLINSKLHQRFKVSSPSKVKYHSRTTLESVPNCKDKSVFHFFGILTWEDIIYKMNK